MARAAWLLVSVALAAGLVGCASHLNDRTDRSVYSAIRERQQAALGETSDVDIGKEPGGLPKSSRMYSRNPRPVDPELPTSFAPQAPRETPPPPPPSNPDSPDRDKPNQKAEFADPPAPQASGSSRNVAEPSASAGGSRAGEQAVPTTQEASEVELLPPSIFSPQQQAQTITFGLPDALAHAQRHPRELQDAKEPLYLVGLDLTLEGHLWTPQFVARAQADYREQGEIGEFDRSLNAVAEAAVSQKLPYGGTVTARVVDTLVRDLAERSTTGESGSVILEADIPLLRGAGRRALESRYRAERGLLYAVRTYERFRRSFLVRIAAEYFELQEGKSSVENTHKSYKSRYEDWLKADFVNRMGQSKSIFEAPRAKSSFRQAEASLVSSKERYATALDRFKISIGMSVEALLDVLNQDADVDAQALDDLLPAITVDEGVLTAMRLRLDLLNSADRVDDARRGINVAKNAVLPDLDAGGNLTYDTDPLHRGTTTFNEDRTAWRAGLELRIDDRKRERNAFRKSIIDARRAERDHERSADTVRADVRRSLRRVAQQENLRLIQVMNVRENEFRLEAARAQFNLGLSTNQDVVDAENDLLAARNQLAAAISGYRNAILEFRRDTDTLRVAADGSWVGAPSRPQEPPRSPTTP